MSARQTTHGMSSTPEFKAWVNMKDRCYNPNYNKFEIYGGAGIKVCAKWRGDFAAFYADMGPRPSPGYSLDRYPDPFGDYEPGNCRWATYKQQRHNRRW